MKNVLYGLNHYSKFVLIIRNSILLEILYTKENGG